MNLNLKAIAAAALLAVAGQASAALSGDSQSDGTLFLTVWDITTNKSYVRDLGVSLDSFLPGGALTAEAGAVRTSGFANFGGSSTFSSHFAGATASNLRWTIIGVDNVEEFGTGSPAQSGSRVVTVVNNTTGNFATVVNGGVRQMASVAAAFQGELVANGNPGLGDGSVIEFTSTGTGSTDGGGSGWGEFLAGSTPFNLAGQGFGSAQFWFGQASNDTLSDDANTANTTRFGNSSFFSTFQLGTDGTVTYNLEGAEVAAVPLPAAVWMMGAGLLSLVGAARRRKAAAQA